MRATFKPVERWPGGYVSAAIITNHGARPVEDWSLSFTVRDGAVVYAWDVEIERLGQRVIVHKTPGDPAIAPGRSVEVDFAAEGTYLAPRGCVINDRPC